MGRNWDSRSWSRTWVYREAEDRARTFLIAISVLLAITAFGYRWWRRGGRGTTGALELRRLLARRRQKPAGVSADPERLRELVGRMSSEQQEIPGQWTAASLKQTLNRHLHGEQIVVSWRTGSRMFTSAMPDGRIEVQHPASGLVTASGAGDAGLLGGVGGARSGSADRGDGGPGGSSWRASGGGVVRLRRVWLSEEEQQGYYYGFSNEGLWPLCHVADARPVFRLEDWRQYQGVNQKFADAVCREVDTRDPIVLVQIITSRWRPR